MAVPFFVAFSGILLVGRYLPFALPVHARAVLAGNNDETPAIRAAKCAVMVAFAGLVLLMSSGGQCSAAGGHGGQQCPAEVAMEWRALWFNSAALFLGMVLGGAAVAMHPHARLRRPIVDVAVEHLTWFTETVTITAFAHDVCIFFKVVETIQK